MASAHHRSLIVQVRRELLRGVVVRERSAQLFREPPVHHLHFAELADHDVRRLQVAVNDPARVREPDRLTDLCERPKQSGAVGGTSSATSTV